MRQGTGGNAPIEGRSSTGGLNGLRVGGTDRAVR
jgi:hypothetical protein